MEKIYDKCCGIEVHKKAIRKFGVTTRELLELVQTQKRISAAEHGDLGIVAEILENAS